jgi:hypothetical protein
MSTTDVAVTATVYAELRAKQEGTDIGPEELEAWLLYADKNYDEDSFTPEEWDGILEAHNRDYQGVHESFREFVEERAGDMWDIDFFLSQYIDWDLLENDWEDDYVSYSGEFGVHVWHI